MLAGSGANNVYGPNFRLDDTTEAEKELFEAAMKDAFEKAEILAKAAGRRLGKVMSINESGGTNSVYPMYEGGGGAGGRGATAEPGTGTVSTSLTVVFEIK